MIKKLLAAITLFCACTCVLHVQAQSIETAATSYQQFTTLRNSGANKNAMYDALYKGYQEFMAVLDASEPNSPEYIQAKNALREIQPQMKFGAFYYSNNGNSANALRFCQAYIDIPLMPIFKGERFAQDANYPNLAYFAASNTYLAEDHARAIKYFRAYLDTGDQRYRQDAYKFMIQSCELTGNYPMVIKVVEEATNNYPNDFFFLAKGINCCQEIGDNDNLQKFVTKALMLKPDDKDLLTIQGKLYEDSNDFQKALIVYNKLLEKNPQSLPITQHLALNYYNLGALNYNKATMAEDEASAKKYSRQSEDYFYAATTVLETIVANDPTSIKYLQALAISYSCLHNEEQLQAVNAKLLSLGGGYIASDVMPTMMTYSDNTMASNTRTSSLGGGDTSLLETSQLPDYTAYAEAYIKTRVEEWQVKDPYETGEEYQERVTETTRNAKIEELRKQAEAEYIDTYAKHVKLNDFTLKPYDAENQVFLVESQYGEIVVPVPRDNNEAKVFENSWNGMQFKNPGFYINGGQLAISSLTFVTPTGNSYRYDVDENRQYVETIVNVSFDNVDNLYAQNEQRGPVRTKRKISTGKSDVDVNIPKAIMPNEKTFALIISNENYEYVSPVPMALNDGGAFRQYCLKTLGLPEKHVNFCSDATFGKMRNAMSELKKLAAAFENDSINIIFYYAGHGVPNEATKDAFLLPIDANGSDTDVCYSLNTLYRELGNLGAASVVVFLDACFSGAGRDDKMLAEARGVALKAKPETPKGNMIVFSAASGDETAYPYRENSHGLFTYFLLKKLQESKGNVTLQELFNYVSSNVKQQSVITNHKSQTPTVNPSPSMVATWQNMKMIVEPPVYIDPTTGEPASLDENGKPIYVDPEEYEKNKKDDKKKK